MGRHVLSFSRNGVGDYGMEASTKRARVPRKGEGAAVWSCPNDFRSHHRSIIPGTQKGMTVDVGALACCAISLCSQQLSLPPLLSTPVISLGSTPSPSARTDRLDCCRCRDGFAPQQMPTPRIVMTQSGCSTNFC